jgi:hypothetical protein
MSATAIDFGKWRTHAGTCDIATLEYIIADCKSAEKAMRGWNPERELYYADQGMTYADELRLRLMGKTRQKRVR